MGLSGFSLTGDFNRMFSFEVLNLDNFETLTFGADLGVLERVLDLRKGVFNFELEEEELEEEGW